MDLQLQWNSIQVLVSLLNCEHLKQLGKPELTKGRELRDVSRNSIPVLGIAYVEVRLKEQHKRLRVVFIDRPDTAFLLGRKWIAEFNLLTVQQATTQVSKPQVAQQTSPNLENHLNEFNDLFDCSNLPPTSRLPLPTRHSTLEELAHVQQFQVGQIKASPMDSKQIRIESINDPIL